MGVFIKTCGLFRDEDINYVNKLNIDFIGFVFVYNSKRRVDESKAYNLKKKLNNNIKVVGVFKNSDIDFIINLINKNIIDMVQLHGDENNDFIFNLKSKVNIPIIKSVGVKDRESFDTNYISDFILLDNYNSGSGNVFDWKYLVDKLDKDNNFKIEFSKKYFLAGGINVNNIKEALLFKPYCIDLSSGLETNGVKDFNKMKIISDAMKNNKIY